MGDGDDVEIKEISVSCGRKKQLDQYEPINEQVTVDAEVPADADIESIVEDLEEEVWDAVDRGVMRRFEEEVRKDD